MIAPESAASLFVMSALARPSPAPSSAPKIIFTTRTTRSHQQLKNSASITSAAMFYRLLQRLTDGQIPEDTRGFRFLTRAPSRS